MRGGGEGANGWPTAKTGELRTVELMRNDKRRFVMNHIEKLTRKLRLQFGLRNRGMSRAAERVIVSLLLIGHLGGPASAGGLSTSAGEVLLSSLQIGRTYKLSQTAGFKLSCMNNSDFTMNIQMQVALPRASETKIGFEPLPEAGWIGLEKASFEGVLSKTNVFNDVTFKIPKDKKLRGKSFQFYVEMVGAKANRGLGGGHVAVALKSRFLITIATQEVETAPGVKLGAYPFRLEPADLFLGKLEPGKVYNLAKNLGKELTLVNPNAVSLKIKLKSMSWKEADVKAREGYPDEPKPHFLTFRNSEIVVPPNGKASVEPYLWLPDEFEVKGKKFMFLLSAEAKDVPIPFGAYSRIYVTVGE